VRLRQAVSMSIDREALAIAATGQDRYESNGIDLDFKINSHIDAVYRNGDYWIDPMGNGLGEGAKYFKRDVAAAKALVSAAGYPNGLDVLAQFPHTYVQPDIQIVAQMATESGIRFKLESVDSRAVWLPRLWVTGDVKGDFDGLSYGDLPMQHHIGTSAYVGWHSKGSFSAARRWDDTQDKLDDLINKTNREFDTAKQKAYMQDFQKQMAVYQSGLSYQYDSKPFILVQPWVKNFRVFQDGRNATGGGSGFSQASLSPGELTFLHIWMDETKRA
jgi:ABC-type transport system substrate-binding protein